MIENARWVLWGFGIKDLALAVGQFMLCATAGLLVLKHALWIGRGRHKIERRRSRRVRVWVELLVALFVSILYAETIVVQLIDVPGAARAQQLALRFSGVEAALQVWAFALLFATLVLSRRDDHPPPP